jgi:hypothetical protein
MSIPRLSRRSGGRGGGGLLARRVALERTRQRELAQLVADHVLGDVHRNMLLSIVYGERQSDELRNDRRTTRPGLDRPLVVRVARLAHFVEQVMVHEGTLLD